MEFQEIIGWLGLAMLLIAWIPQTWDTIKAGETHMNLAFILLYALSSAFLTLYSFFNNDTVFLVLNAMLTLGSGINLYYKFFPRKTDG